MRRGQRRHFNAIRGQQMQIDKDTVVQFHYQLHDGDGNEIETSDRSEPMAYLHGAGNIIPGLEKALAGHSAGDHVQVEVAPEEGYGPRQDNMVQRIPAKYLKHAGKLKPGMQVQLKTEEGPRWVTVIKVGLKAVDVDANHPLAGKVLRFSVEIVDVRAATDEERQHGHAHGPGGHHH